EQHRFGVAQRLALRQKGIGDAHQLMMSATPIPRTLAMTFYADLDVSVIDEMPPGRTPVATRLVSQRRRAEVVERARRLCASGGQVYWVCPLIEESEKLELQTAVASVVARRRAPACFCSRSRCPKPRRRGSRSSTRPPTVSRSRDRTF